MPPMPAAPSRRAFLATSALATLHLPLLAQQAAQQPAPPAPAPRKRLPYPAWIPPYDRTTINLIGPRSGFTPQIGTVVSMLTWMESAILGPTRSLTQPELDALFDQNANSIGALMLHLAATEVLYQRLTFDGLSYDALMADPTWKTKWASAMDLGDAGRRDIKGHPLVFYTDTLREVREHSLAEFQKRDDAWLLAVDKDWPWGPTNTFCKWFHVCEHISHHAGQIDLLLKRLPGAKAEAAAG